MKIKAIFSIYCSDDKDFTNRIAFSEDEELAWLMLKEKAEGSCVITQEKVVYVEGLADMYVVKSAKPLSSNDMITFNDMKQALLKRANGKIMQFTQLELKALESEELVSEAVVKWHEHNSNLEKRKNNIG